MATGKNSYIKQNINNNIDIDEDESIKSFINL
jgi:hypothetical protein